MNNQPKSPFPPRQKKAAPSLDGWTKKDTVLMWLVYPVAAAMAGILIWALNRDPSWASKLNTLLTARQYWHSFNFKELMFLGLGGVVIVALIFLRINGYFADRREKLEQKAAAAWNRSLAPLVDISDYPDRDDLYFYLETGDRPRLLDALRRMPRGSRSLRAAVAAIDPDLLDEPA